MLPAAHRLRTGDDFQPTVRGGRRAGSRTLVAHLDTPDRGGAEPRVGLVVSRAVGTAVTRNRVKRHLRHLARERLSDLPAGSVLVLRARPAAAGASSAVLARDLDRALDRTLERAPGRAPAPLAGGGTS